VVQVSLTRLFPSNEYSHLVYSVGLAICTTILNSFVKKELRKQLDSTQITAVGQSLGAINDLTPAQQTFVRETFGRGYALQMWMLLGFSGMVVLSSLIMWENTPKRLQVEDVTS